MDIGLSLPRMPMMISARRFRPTWWGVALTVAGCAAFISLGNWQTRRAQEKRALAAKVDAALNGRRSSFSVMATGRPAALWAWPKSSGIIAARAP